MTGTARPTRRRRRGLWPFTILAAGIVGAGAWFYGYNVYAQDGPATEDGSPRTVMIEQGSGVPSIARTLKDAGAIKDEFEFTGYNNSYLLEQRIAPSRGLPDKRRREIYKEVDRRGALLQKLGESGVSNFYELFKLLSKAQKQGLF